MLGLMVGDALGAAVEGFSPEEIEALAFKHFGSRFVNNYIKAVPMWTFVADKEPGQYRPAWHVDDMNFVGCGPASNANTESQCARYGMYTDDTCSCLAIGKAIVVHQCADAAGCAESCAKLFLRENEYFRGCPPTAKQTLDLILQGASPSETGLPPHFPFLGGSFANGGAMRISPLALAYRNADGDTLREAVTAAICASHRHPEAIDFAVVQAAAVQQALKMQPEEFDAQEFLRELLGRCQVSEMQDAIKRTHEAVALASQTWTEDTIEANVSTMRGVVNAVRRPGSSMDFQIASIHMMPCVLWCVCRYARHPQKAIQMAIALGGDTDTTASMVGAIVGALHGEDFLREPVDWIAELENGPHGRDFAARLAEQLLELDLA